MDRPYCILLADDHVGFRREVRKILEEIPDVNVTGEAGNRRELFELLRQSPPKLVILDMSMPDLRAGEGTQLIKLHYPETKVLIMVMDQESEYLTHGLAAGAAGSCRNNMWRDKSPGPLPQCARGKSICRPRSRGIILTSWPRQRGRSLTQVRNGQLINNERRFYRRRRHTDRKLTCQEHMSASCHKSR